MTCGRSIKVLQEDGPIAFKPEINDENMRVNERIHFDGTIHRHDEGGVQRIEIYAPDQPRRVSTEFHILKMHKSFLAVFISNF